MNIELNRKIHGAIDTSPSDTLVERGGNISNEGEIYVLKLSSLNPKLSDEYASFIIKSGNGENVSTFIHFQGSHVSFPNLGRYYTTRAIYEISREDMESIEYRYSDIAPIIPKMRHRNGVSLNTETKVTINCKSTSKNTLNLNEQKIYKIIKDNLINHHGQQLFIKLKNDNHQYYENGVLSSARLLSILKVVDCLPKELRKYISISFSVDKRLKDLYADSFIIAYQDGDWEVDTTSGIAIDWTTDNISDYDSIDSEIDNDILEQLIPYFLQKLKELPSSDNSDRIKLFGGIKSEIDTAINNNDQEIIKKIYLLGKGTYRYGDSVNIMAKYYAQNNKQEELKQIILKHPNVRSLNEVKSYIVGIINSTTQISDLKDWYNLCKNDNILKDKIIDKIAITDIREIVKYSEDKEYTELLKVAREKVKKNRWTTSEMIEFVNVDYLGISIENININNWQDLFKLYNKIKSNRNRLNEFKECFSWNISAWDIASLKEKEYNEIEKYIPEDHKSHLRQKVAKQYLINKNYSFIFTNKAISKSEFINLKFTFSDVCKIANNNFLEKLRKVYDWKANITSLGEDFNIDLYSSAISNNQLSGESKILIEDLYKKLIGKELPQNIGDLCKKLNKEDRNTIKLVSEDYLNELTDNLKVDDISTIVKLLISVEQVKEILKELDKYTLFNDSLKKLKDIIIAEWIKDENIPKKLIGDLQCIEKVIRDEKIELLDVVKRIYKSASAEDKLILSNKVENYLLNNKNVKYQKTLSYIAGQEGFIKILKRICFKINIVNKFSINKKHLLNTIVIFLFFIMSVVSYYIGTLNPKGHYIPVSIKDTIQTIKVDTTNYIISSCPIQFAIDKDNTLSISMQDSIILINSNHKLKQISQETDSINVGLFQD